MTDVQIFLPGCETDFAELVRTCEKHGDYCLIGGHAVNAYSYSTYTADVDLVVASSKLEAVAADLAALGFKREDFEYSVNFRKPGSRLLIQFSTEKFYQDYCQTAVIKTMYDMPVKVASLENVIRGKIRAWQEPQRRPTKRLKDELDLARLLESHPAKEALFPAKIIAIVYPTRKESMRNKSAFSTDDADTERPSRQ